jgi:hypothetical protein
MNKGDWMVNQEDVESDITDEDEEEDDSDTEYGGFAQIVNSAQKV